MMLDFADKYTWEQETRRYRDNKTGRFLSKEAVLQLTKLRIQQAQKDLQRLGDRLLNNKITLKTWQKQTAQLLKILHTQQYLLGVGGEAQIQTDDYSAIASELLAQYQYLQNFALGLTQGKVSPPQFKVRLGMYASAAKVSYYRGEKESALRSGLDGAKRVLGQTDHHCPQCLEYAARGVVPIDEVVYPTQQ